MRRDIVVGSSWHEGLTLAISTLYDHWVVLCVAIDLRIEQSADEVIKAIISKSNKNRNE